MNDKKRQYYEEVFGKEEAAKIITEVENKAAALAEFEDFKDFLELPEEGDKKDNDQKPPDPQDGTKALLGEFSHDLSELTQFQLKLTQRAKSMFERLEAQETRIKALETELSGTPRRASDDKSTVIDIANDEDLAKLVRAIKDKEAKDHDPLAELWQGLVEEEA